MKKTAVLPHHIGAVASPKGAETLLGLHASEAIGDAGVTRNLENLKKF